jgi:hypothetical protein
LDAIGKELEKSGIFLWLSSSQLIGISTEGVASMIDTEYGLILKTVQNMCHIIGVHCVVQQVNLRVLSSFKKLNMY